MTALVEQLVGKLRRLPSGAASTLLLALLAALSVLALGDREGLLDWDTYSRLQFMPGYRPDLYHDSHILYHHLLRWLHALGFSFYEGVQLLTASSYAAFVVLLWQLCRREGLAPRRHAYVMAFATVGSPGLVALFLAMEDNVTYFPILLALFYLLPRDAETSRENVRLGVYAGLLVALGMLLNVTALIFLLALLALPVLAILGFSRATARLSVMIGVALAAYYLAHFTIFRGCRIALHDFLPQALALKDFAQSSTPLFSAARVGQYLGGLRAIAWAPTVHFMQLPRAWAGPLLSYLPWALALLYAPLVYLFVRTRPRDGGARERLFLGLVAYGLALTFPYFYEPALIERWDIFWLGAIVLLVAFLRRPMVPVARALLLLVLLLQVGGTLLVVSNHYGLSFVSPLLSETRKLAVELRQKRVRVLVLPRRATPIRVAYLRHHVPGALIHLVDRDKGRLRVYLLFGLREVAIPHGVLVDRLRRGQARYLDAALERGIVSELGVR